MKAVQFEEAVAMTGHGRFHWKLQAICGFCVLATTIEMICISYILPSAQCDLHFTTQNKGVLSAISYLGMICSSHLWGFLADTRGRRKVLVLTLLLDSACSILSSFSHTFWALVIFRFFNGFFVCGAAAVICTFLGEFHSTRTRARAIVWIGVFVALGTISLPGLAWLVIPQKWSFELPWYTYNSWRIFLVVAALPEIAAAVLMLMLPRSPKFLLAMDKEREALAVLQHMYTLNTGNKSEEYEVKSVYLSYEQRKGHDSALHPAITSTKSTQKLFKNMWVQTAPLFRTPYLTKTSLTCALYFLVFCCCNGFLLWLPEIFSRLATYATLNPSHDFSVCEAIVGAVSLGVYHANDTKSFSNMKFNQSVSWLTGEHGDVFPKPECNSNMEAGVFQNTLIIGGVAAVVYITAGYLVSYVEKKKILIFNMTTAGLAGIAFYFVRSDAAVLTLACIFVSLANICVSIINSITVDLFPTQLRGMAVSLSLMFGRLGTVVGSMLVGVLLELSCVAAFGVLSGSILCCGFFALFIPTTKKLLTE